MANPQKKYNFNFSKSSSWANPLFATSKETPEDNTGNKYYSAPTDTSKAYYDSLFSAREAERQKKYGEPIDEPTSKSLDPILKMISPHLQPDAGKKIGDIVNASREKRFTAPVTQQSNLGLDQNRNVVEAPRSRKIDPITQTIIATLLSPPKAAIEGLQGGYDTAAEAGKEIAKGNVVGGLLGGANATTKTLFGLLNVIQPELAAFTAGTTAAGEIGGGPVKKGMEEIMSPVTTLTQPKSYVGKQAAQIGDLIATLVGAHTISRGIGDIKSSFGKDINRTLPGSENFAEQPVEPTRGGTTIDQLRQRIQQPKETENVSSQQKTTASNGDSRTRAEQTIQAEQGIKENVQEPASRLRSNEPERLTGKQKRESKQNQQAQENIPNAEKQISPADKRKLVDNNANAIKNLTALNKTPEEISKVLKVPVKEVKNQIQGKPEATALEPIQPKEEVKPTTEGQQALKEKSEQRKEWTKQLDEQSKKSDIVDITEEGGFRTVLAKSTKQPGKWQITKFGKDGQPFSDLTFDTKSEALQELKNTKGQLNTPDNEFVYSHPTRPVSSFTVPFDKRFKRVEEGNFNDLGENKNFGKVIFNKPLTPKEMADYELYPIKNGKLERPKIEGTKPTTEKPIQSPAIKTSEGEVITGGKNHNEIIKNNPKAKGGVKGFVDNEGNFLTRREASDKAKQAGQVTEEAPKSIHSEDFEKYGEGLPAESQLSGKTGQLEKQSIENIEELPKQTEKQPYEMTKDEWENQPNIFYHGSNKPIIELKNNIHLGKKEQALMRNDKNISSFQVDTKLNELSRSKDTGGNWEFKIQNAKKEGKKGIVYLNRYEGMTTNRIEILDKSNMLDKLDNLSDKEFKKYVPEAKDSYIIFDKNNLITHKSVIEKALQEGKTVPPEVLKDYPDLAEKYGKGEPQGNKIEQPIVKETPEPLTKEVPKTKKRVISEDAYKKAHENLVKSLGKLTAGIDPTVLKDLATVGAYHVENGIRNFADWSKRMVDDYGDKIKPHLKDIWDRVNPKEQGTEEAKNLAGTQTPKEAGIAQRIRESRSDITGIKPSEIGIGWTGEEALNRGRDLIRQGIDPNEVVKDFNKDGKLSDDTIAIVRARAHDLQIEANKIGDKYGVDSKEYKEALNKAEDWSHQIKPMQTQSSRIFAGQKGGEDIDTGTFTGMQIAYKKETGKDFNESQSTRVKELTNRVKKLTEREQQLNDRINELISKNVALEKSQRTGREIKAASKQLADKIRTAKIHRPGVFAAATPASLAWDLGVETVARTIETGGQVAQAIANGLDAIKKTDWYKGLTEDKKREAESEFWKWHNEQIEGKNKAIDITTKFIDQKDNKFTTDEVKAIWQRAKEGYIDKGTGDFEDMLSGLSKETGLSREQIRDAITQPKSIKNITDEMYRIRNARMKAIQNAKMWLKDANTPGYLKFAKALPRAFFGLRVFGHGTVGMITHAGMEIFRPSSWRTYFTNFGRQFKFAYGSTEGYEKAMSDLKNDSDFIFWKRAGLAVDPDKVYDDYQGFGKVLERGGAIGEKASKIIGRIAEAGTRGFQILKIHRLETAKAIWEHLSEVEKSDPNTAKEIAKIVNHSTGTADVKIPQALNVAFFAPRLEASRWARLVVEPTKAIKTFIGWKDASIADKTAAKLITKRSGEMMGTYAGLLAANSALLALSGSGQKINYTDPTKSDWLRFKAGNKVIDVSGGMLSTMTFIAKLFDASIKSQKSLKGKDRTDIIYQALGNYASGKVSPFAGTLWNFWTHHDYAGNVLPPFNDEPKEGRENLDWGQYLLREQTPIPIAEGINDVYQSMKDKGMADPQVRQILSGVIVSFGSGGTGARIREEFKYPEPKQSNLEKSGLEDSEQIQDVQRQEKVVKIMRDRVLNKNATKRDYQRAIDKLNSLKQKRDWKKYQYFINKQRKETDKKLGRTKRKDPLGIL